MVDIKLDFVGPGARLALAAAARAEGAAGVAEGAVPAITDARDDALADIDTSKTAALAGIPALMQPYVDAAGAAARLVGGSQAFPIGNTGLTERSAFVTSDVTGLTLGGESFTILAAIGLPVERCANINEQSIAGNDGAGTGAGDLRLVYVGEGNSSSANQRKFKFSFRAGSVATRVVYSGARPENDPSTRYGLIVRHDRAAMTLALDAVSLDTMAHNPGASSDVTGWAARSLTNNLLMIGDARSGAAASYGTTARQGWTGDIQAILIVKNVVVTDADADAYFKGTATAVSLWGVANCVFVREYDAGKQRLAKPVWATADTYGALVQYGTFARQGSTIIPPGNVALKRRGDYRIEGVLPGEDCAPYPLEGLFPTPLPAADTAQYRLHASDGTALTAWLDSGPVAAGATSYRHVVTMPASKELPIKAVRLKSAPDKVSYDTSYSGVGIVPWAAGQSQLNNTSGRTTGGYVGRGRGGVIRATGVNQQRWQIGPIGHGGLESDLVAAMIDQIQVYRDWPVAVVLDAIGGTSPAAWIDDTDNSRRWVDTVNALTYFGGRLSGLVWQWFTAFRTAGAGAATGILDPVVRGVGAGAKSHFIFERLKAGAALALSPPSRHERDGSGGFPSGGAYDFDGVQYVDPAAEAMQAWWAARGGKSWGIGSFPVDLRLVDSYHQEAGLYGDIRLGWHLGIAFARAMGWDRSVDPYPDPASFRFTSAGKTAFTFDVVLPNGGQLRNGLGNTIDTTGTPDLKVGGVEISTDAGATWSVAGLADRMGVISGRARITCTKASGDWTAAASLRVRVNSGGPFGYGLGSTEGNTVAEKYCMYDGYDACLNGLGLPVGRSSTVYTVGAA